MHEPLHADKTLLSQVLASLRDPIPQIRRAAVLAIGVAEEAISKEDMLPLLQDPDAEVRRLCEKALRGRGLDDTYIKLAKLISDQRPGSRLQVVHYLHDAEDSISGSGVWLQHLSQDPSPAVRAAAIRFAGEDPAGSDFRERMLQMSRDDPSPTVRQLALHYLKTSPGHD
jgi:HEAT repeat protein